MEQQANKRKKMFQIGEGASAISIAVDNIPETEHEQLPTSEFQQRLRDPEVFERIVAALLNRSLGKQWKRVAIRVRNKAAPIIHLDSYSENGSTVLLVEAKINLKSEGSDPVWTIWGKMQYMQRKKPDSKIKGLIVSYSDPGEEVRAIAAQLNVALLTSKDLWTLLEKTGIVKHTLNDKGERVTTLTIAKVAEIIDSEGMVREDIYIDQEEGAVDPERFWKDILEGSEENER